MNIRKIETRLERLAPVPPPPRYRRTTAETRQELDRVLGVIGRRPPGRPHRDPRGLAEAQAEVDRVLAVLARLDGAEVRA
ncbi:MAG: hypothetical protein JXP73_03275 [Deltaproteobacteria bacterium]|nr:hypothetical protein [Deltaproteobacteria bacterium]